MLFSFAAPKQIAETTLGLETWLSINHFRIISKLFALGIAHENACLWGMRKALRLDSLKMFLILAILIVSF